jgi:hypothetical protein
LGGAPPLADGSGQRSMTIISYAPVRSECLAAAHKYLSSGWAVVAVCPPDHAGESSVHVNGGYGAGGRRRLPCRSPGKAPVIPWRRFQSGTLPTSEELDYWWSGDHVHRNVGLICGSASRLAGIDIDGQAGALQLHTLSDGDLPPTLEFETPGGGRRLLYSVPSGVQIRTTHLPILDQRHAGISFLGHGGHTVLPPSRHVNGGRYVWTDQRSPDDIQAVTAPSWLLKKLATASEPSVAERSTHRTFDGQPAVAGVVINGCPFLQHCRDHASTLPEPLWFAMLSIVARTDRGDNLAHELSRPYRSYGTEECNAKIAHALESAGPRTCHWIDENTGGRWCRECQFRGQIKSPIVLGSRAKLIVNDRIPEQNPVIQRACASSLHKRCRRRRRR